jgi:hypothetical protein
MERIEQLYAFVTDEGGGEGIPATDAGPFMMPLISGSKSIADKMKETAQLIADKTGRKLTLVRFSAREELDEIKPRTMQ